MVTLASTLSPTITFASSSNTDDQTLALRISKSGFDLGELVVVDGSSENPVDGRVSLLIRASDGSVYKSEQVMVDYDFHYQFKLPVDLAFVGEWQMTAQYEKDGDSQVTTELFSVRNQYEDGMSLRVTDIEYRSNTGQTVKIIPADKPVVFLLSILSISNDAHFDQLFTTIVQVLDSTGVAVFLSFQTANLHGHDSNEYGFSWVPDKRYLIQSSPL